MNTRDPTSALLPNQLAVKENVHTDNGGFFEQRRGQDLLSITPPNPVPFASDADTLALWHLDEAVGAGDFVDSGPNGEDLSVPTEASIIRQAPAVFPTATPYGVKFKTAAPALKNGLLKRTILVGSPFLAAQAEITVDAWVIIPPSFTGRINTMGVGAPPAIALATWSNSGAPLASWSNATTFHGLRIWRDSTAVAPIRDTSDPYVTWEFKLNTYAAPFVLTTAQLPTNRKLHIRATYSAAKRRARLWVNGTLQQTTAIPLAGSLEALPLATGPKILLGGSDAATVRGASFTGTLDEVRISSVVRADDDWPYDKLHAPLMPFAKADGTRQLVMQAGGGLYYEVGDGKLNLISATDPADGDPFSEETNFSGRQFGDILYLSNGTDTPLAWNGTRLLSWGEPIAPPTLTETAGPMTATAGEHLMRYRYRYGDYVTGPGPSASINLSVGNINADDLLTRDSNCTAIQVEMTKAGVDDVWFLAREIPNDPNVTKLSVSGAWVYNGDPSEDEGAIGLPDGGTPTNLNDNAAYFQRTAEENAISIGRPKYLLPAHARMFISGDVNRPYSVPFSSLLNADCFYPYAVANFKTNAGEVVGMGLSHDDILISKGGKSTSCLRGIDPSGWIIAEDIHPTRGAVDHWSFVHRYPGSGGPYVLLSLCEDGVYAYQDGSMDRVSDLITPTMLGLAASTASRQDWIDTTYEDFEGAKTEGGSATGNIDTPSYEQDGLREIPGQVRIVNQLDYIGLWGGTVPLVAGKVTAQAKGAAEGEFYFCTDAGPEIYRTTDNFVTAAALTVALNVNYRGIELLRFLDAAGTEYLIIFTAWQGQDYGQILRLIDPVGVAGIGPSLMTLSSGPGASPFWYWQVDVPWVAGSEFWNRINIPQGNANDNRDFHRLGNGGLTDVGAVYDFAGAKNLFINHPQSVIFGINNANGRVVIDNQPTAVSATPSYGSTIFDPFSGFTYANNKPYYYNGATVLLAPGFYGVHDDGASVRTSTGSLSHWDATDSTGGFKTYFTRRETSLYNGGTFRPQSFFFDNGAQQYVYFLGAGDEDVYGNRETLVYQIDIVTGVLVSISGNASSLGFDAATNTGWYTELYLDAATFGFKVFVGQFDAANGNFLDGENLDKADYLPLRLEWNQNSASMAMIGKRFGSDIAAANARDTFTYQGFVAGATLHPAADTTIAAPAGYAFDVDGDSGPIPVEMAYQTDLPCAEHIVVDRLTTAAVLSLDQTHAFLTIEEATPYVSPDVSTIATGIGCQLLFVEKSDAAGGNLWADRLYWQTRGNGAPRFVQRGVEGYWTVIGDFISETKDLGAPTAFGSFLAVSSGPQVDFHFRNAATVPLLAASEIAVTANKKLVGFAPVKEYAQWHAVLTWTYDPGAPTVSPLVDSVDVVFYLGTPSVPRICAEHFNGRTYFFVATTGSLVNDLVLVFDKKNAWGVFTGWKVESCCMFLGQFVGLQNFDLVALESSDDDLGKKIIVKVRPGTLMADMDVFLDDLAANVQTWDNKEFYSVAGSMLVKPYAGVTPIAAGIWKFAIPAEQYAPLADKVEQMRRVLGEPNTVWAEGWGNAFSIQIETDPVNGVMNQRAVVQAIEGKMVVQTPERERYVR